MTTASDQIAARLHAAGCRHAFGIPGGEVLHLMQALDRVGIKMTLVRHENCAGFMGEGVHHHDGAPAILVATIGPGLANAANVIANAHQDRVPMIVLTGCVTALHQHTYTHQVFDHVKLCEPVTKAAFRVEAGTAGVVADKAVMVATSGRPGPVLLDVPVDVQASAAGAQDLPFAAPVLPSAPAPGVAFDKAKQWLAEAKRPLVIAGVDVLNQDCARDVEAFCRETGSPLITTYKAKGIVPEDDPLSLGGAGLSPLVDDQLLPLVETADLIVLAGYDPIEMRTGWQNPWAPDARVIDLAAEANSHFMHQARLNFVGHVGASLQALLAGHSRGDTWPDGEPAKAKAAIVSSLNTNEVWGPAAVIDECRSALPRNTIATVDSGAHRILLSQVWQCYEPRGLLQSTALCTMGCAVPLAIGRKLAEPERPVVAFVGDAGLEMFLGELATIRDLKLGIPVVVFIDESLGLIEKKQRGQQMPNLAVDFGATDFPAVATAMGGEGAWVHDRAALAAELGEALKRDTFTLIAAVIGRRAYDGRI